MDQLFHLENHHLFLEIFTGRETQNVPLEAALLIHSIFTEQGSKPWEISGE